MDEDKLMNDDLKRHRVGGRLVTRKEILRSKKCLHIYPLSFCLVTDTPLVVSELAELFWHLEHADIVSVAPTMELARLALITSRDEEDDIEQTVTDLDAGPSGMGGAAELEMKDVETPGAPHQGKPPALARASECQRVIIEEI
jgi:hypothetical protein